MKRYKDLKDWNIINIKIIKIMKKNKVKNEDENLPLFVYAVLKH